MEIPEWSNVILLTRANYSSNSRVGSSFWWFGAVDFLRLLDGMGSILHKALDSFVEFLLAVYVRTVLAWAASASGVLDDLDVVVVLLLYFVVGFVQFYFWFAKINALPHDAAETVHFRWGKISCQFLFSLIVYLPHCL